MYNNMKQRNEGCTDIQRVQDLGTVLRGYSIHVDHHRRDVEFRDDMLSREQARRGQGCQGNTEYAPLHGYATPNETR